MKRKCKQCDVEFRVDILEQEWCRTQGLSLPRRCLSCRATRREVVDVQGDCAACGTAFLLPAECVLLANLLSWQGPYKCEGCSTETAPTNTSRQLWELNARLLEPCIDDTAADEGGPALPEDLFKDLDKAPLAEPATPPAGSHGADSVNEVRSTTDGVGLPPTQPSSENVPSPDDLFKSLASPSRRSE